MKPLASSSSRERILSRIRQALTHTTPPPFPELIEPDSYFVKQDEDLAVQFAEQFSALQGKFVYCLTLADLYQNLSALIQNKGWASIYWNDSQIDTWLKPMDLQPTTDLPGCDASITSCDFLTARTGSVLLSTGSGGSRTSSVYAPIHITIAHCDQLVPDLPQLFSELKTKYGNQLPSFLSLASGPSRTADIEKTLVTGIHGPKEIYLFLVESLNNMRGI